MFFLELPLKILFIIQNILKKSVLSNFLRHMQYIVLYYVVTGVAKLTLWPVRTSCCVLKIIHPNLSYGYNLYFEG